VLFLFKRLLITSIKSLLPFFLAFFQYNNSLKIEINKKMGEIIKTPFQPIIRYPNNATIANNRSRIIFFDIAMIYFTLNNHLPNLPAAPVDAKTAPPKAP